MLEAGVKAGKITTVLALIRYWNGTAWTATPTAVSPAPAAGQAPGLHAIS